MSVVAIAPHEAEAPTAVQTLSATPRQAGARGGPARSECTCPEFCELDHAND